MTRKEKKKNLHDNLNHSIQCLVHYKDDKETFEHYQKQVDYIVAEILGMVPEEHCDGEMPELCTCERRF